MPEDETEDIPASDEAPDTADDAEDCCPGCGSDDGIILRMQLRVQPSFSIAFPSSHCSLLSVIPSPQRGIMQLGRHLSGATAFPGPLSHCSPASSVAFPQRRGMENEDDEEYHGGIWEEGHW
jgi:hypothetical protein